MNLPNSFVDKFCDTCENLNSYLKLDDTFENLETGGTEYTYNSLVFCVIDAVFSMGVILLRLDDYKEFKLTEDELIDDVTKRVLDKYLDAFKKLAE